MKKGEIEQILIKHTHGAESFLDEEGKSHWYNIIDEIYALNQAERKEEMTARQKAIASQGSSKNTHKHYDDWGYENIIGGPIESCTFRNCLVVTHRHVEKGNPKTFGKIGSVKDCTEYCQQAGVYTLDTESGEWLFDEKSNNELPPEDRVVNPWTRDCLFTADMMRTVHTRLTGKILTLIDASVPEPKQNKALKDLIHNVIWGETWNPIVKWMRENKKGLNFPFYHEPQGLDG